MVLFAKLVKISCQDVSATVNIKKVVWLHHLRSPVSTKKSPVCQCTASVLIDEKLADCENYFTDNRRGNKYKFIILFISIF